MPGAEDNPLTIVTLANAITLSGGTRRMHAAVGVTEGKAK
jgi:hypothetical protein